MLAKRTITRFCERKYAFTKHIPDEVGAKTKGRFCFANLRQAAVYEGADLVLGGATIRLSRRKENDEGRKIYC
ncbi:hypothetical protein A9P82_13020 [Arachidicoccus ginsenosidimutans]|nr:hypothetical protein A9P82_13020 [Arachidicoccus sp. BS20]